LIRLGIVPGDGVGPEVMTESLNVLAAVAAAEGIRYALVQFDLGGERYLRTGEVLPDSVIEELRGCDAVLLGAVGHPKVMPGVLEKGILLRLRFAFRQYINLRPIQLFPGVACPLAAKGPDEIDMVVVRENNEDLYVGAGGCAHEGTPDEVAIQTSINTRAGVERTVRFAFELARQRGRDGRFRGLSPTDVDLGAVRKLTMVAKTNVLTFAHGLWMRTFTEVSRDYPEIKSEYQHVDACAMRMVLNPEQYDVIVTTNLFGDILTDLGAALQGGMGLAASANLAPERSAPSMFEPVHGSAPDIAGKNVANPLAAILSTAMMLEHLNHPGAARKIRAAVRRVLQQPGPRTADLGGQASTDAVGRAVVAALGS
jgi:3-isopropylmalate dehydrogenase